MSEVVLTPRLWLPGPGAVELFDRLPKGTRIEKRVRRLWDGFLLMAGSAGDTYEAKLLDLLWGATALTAPSPLFFGLWGTAGSLTDSSTGGTAGEVSGGSYARVSVTNNGTNFGAATGTAPTVKKNATAITFPTATANWNSGNPINQMACLDGNAGTSADKILVWSDLTVAKTILNGDTGQFAVNDFQVTCD